MIDKNEYVNYFIKKAKKFGLEATHTHSNRNGIHYEISGRSNFNTLIAKLNIHTHVEPFLKTIFSNEQTNVDVVNKLFDQRNRYEMVLQHFDQELLTYGAWKFPGLESITKGNLLEHDGLYNQITKQANKVGIETFAKESETEGFVDYVNLAFACFSIPQKYLIAAERQLKK